MYCSCVLKIEVIWVLFLFVSLSPSIVFVCVCVCVSISICRDINCLCLLLKWSRRQIVTMISIKIPLPQSSLFYFTFLFPPSSSYPPFFPTSSYNLFPTLSLPTFLCSRAVSNFPQFTFYRRGLGYARVKTHARPSQNILNFIDILFLGYLRRQTINLGIAWR